PSLEPMPRPTRTFLMREPRGGRRVERLNAGAPVPAARDSFLGADLRLPPDFFLIAIFAFPVPLLHDFHEVTHLVDHAADCRRVFALDSLVHAAQTEAPDGGTHIIGAADEADHPLDLDLAAGSFGGGFLFVSHWRSLLRQPF